MKSNMKYLMLKAQARGAQMYVFVYPVLLFLAVRRAYVQVLHSQDTSLDANVQRKRHSHGQSSTTHNHNIVRSSSICEVLDLCSDESSDECYNDNTYSHMGRENDNTATDDILPIKVNLKTELGGECRTLLRDERTAPPRNDNRLMLRHETFNMPSQIPSAYPRLWNRPLHKTLLVR